jgi:hypothetical protein
MSDDELRRAYQARLPRPSGTPPTAEELARLASGVGSEEERAELLDRALADPSTARDFELLRALATAERGDARPATRRWAVPLSLAASLLLAVAGYLMLRPVRIDDTVRAPVAEGGTMLVDPEEAATLRPGAITFSWRAAPRATSYRLELLTEAGALALSQETFDTSMTVPVLEGGAYRWLVVGLLPDGLETASRPRRLTITP